jgi:uncharacterized C2H2 Zn-finger protein
MHKLKEKKKKIYLFLFSSTIEIKKTKMPKVKRGEKRHHSSTTGNIANNSDITDSTSIQKKSRIQKYCPDKIDFKLECEWSDCSEIFNDMDNYLSHIEVEHLTINDTDHRGEAAQQQKCQWRECDYVDYVEFENKDTFKRHVRYHAFHNKLKQIGESVLQSLATQRTKDENETGKQSTNLTRCNLDEQTKNIIPELPYRFECSWSDCEYNNDNPELFYRHIKREHIDPYPPKLKDSKCRWSNCEQILSNKNRLAEHMRHHTQEKLVACPVCGALFASFTKLIDHCSRSSSISSNFNFKKNWVHLNCACGETNIFFYFLK